MFEVTHQKIIGSTAAGSVHRFACTLLDQGETHQGMLDLLVLASGGIERHAPRKLTLNRIDYTQAATARAIHLLGQMGVGDSAAAV